MGRPIWSAAVKVATSEVTVGDVTLPANSPGHALVRVGEQRRERLRGTDAVRPRPGRLPNLTFGGGVHACAGTYYASAVVRIALEELFDAIPNLELDETHDVDFWGWGFRGPKELHVTWEV